MDRPKVLIVDLSLRFGGASRRALNLLKLFPDGMGALASLEGSPVTGEARRQGSVVYPVGRNRIDPVISRRLMRAVDDFGARVVDSYNVQSKFWSSFAAVGARTALVSTLNSWYAAEHANSMKGRLYQAIESMTNRRLDVCVCASQDVYDRLLGTGISPDVAELIPNAIAFDRTRLKSDKKWLLETFNLPADAQVVCLVGRLVWAKGVDVLVTAFRRLKDRFPTSHCLIIGDGELRDPLTKQIQRYGLADRIHLAGFVEPDEVLSIVASCDVFVIPSRSEAIPLALLEAAALGKPIVAARVGGIPEVVEHEEHGLLVDPGDADGVARGVARLLSEPDYAHALGQRAKARVEASFSLNAQVEATLRAYDKAWERAQRRLR